MKKLFYVAGAKKAIERFPEEVQDVMLFALSRAQEGKKHIQAKVLRGFGGASVLEIVEKDMGNAYRGVYTVQFKDAVYVLHAFQKKSTRGIKTNKQDIDMVKERLKVAEEHHKKTR